MKALFGSTFFALSSDMLSVAGFDGSFQELNPAWTQALGWDSNELLAQPLLDLVHPDDRKQTEAHLAELALGSASANFENRYQHKNGSYRWIDWTCTSDSSQGLIFAVARDVTLSKDHVRRSQAFIQSITDAIPDPIFVKDSKRRFLWGNKAFSQMLKLEPAEYLGKTDYDFFSKEMADWFWAKDTVVFDSQNETETEEPMVDAVNGGFRTILTKKTPCRLEDGSQILVGVIRDITERKKSEERSRTLHALIESSDEAFAYFDPQGRPIFLNSAARERFGLDPNAKSIARYFPQELVSLIFNEILPVVARGTTWEGETALLNAASGESVPVWQRFFSLPDDKGLPAFYATIAMDIRQRKAAEAKLQHSAKLSALGEMAGGIAHEINNPLAIIHGRASQLVQLAAQGPVSPGQVIDAAGKIESTAMRISKIVKALRSFAREMEGEPFAEVTLKSVVDDTLEFCRERFRSHSVELDCAGVAESLKLECMPVQLSQVLLNLLNNAFDAISSQPVRWVKLAGRRCGDQIEIEVRDSGSGISRAVAEKIMQPFFTTKEIGKGTGLGLSVSKGIVESHGGSLVLDSDCANTRFVIRVPVRAVKRGAQGKVA